MKLLVLYGLLFPTLLQQVTIKVQAKLGLIYRTKEVSLARSERTRQVDIFVPVTKSYSEYESAVNKTVDIYKKLKAIPGLANTTTQYKEVGHVLESIGTDLKFIEASLKVMTAFKDRNNPKVPSTKCSARWVTYEPNWLESIVKELGVVTKGMNEDSTSATLTANKEEYKTLVSILKQVSSIVNDVNKKLLDRVNLLEQISNRILDPEVLTAIQAIGCINWAEIEVTKIVNSEKISTGLLSTVEVSILDNRIKAQFYSILNYNGIQLSLEGGNYLVKIGSAWKILLCPEDKDDILDNFDHCQQGELKNKCSEQFDSEKLEPYLTHCKFEKRIPKTSEITDEGILIQGIGLEIQLLNAINDPRPERVTQKPPLFITGSKLVKIIKGDFEEIVSPRTDSAQEKILDTWLTEDDISRLENMVPEDGIFTIEDYLEMAGGVFLLVLSILVGITLKKQSQTPRYTGVPPQEMLLRKNKAKKNLKENKRVQYL
jgi:hypothetical protein